MAHTVSLEGGWIGGGGVATMAMYMSGFQWSLFADPSEVPCLNLFSPSWTLDTRPKFFLGMLAVLLLALVTEGVSFLRMKMSKKPIERERRRRNSRTWRGKRKASLFRLGLHGLQALLGYLLMIAAMTYSIELLLSAIVGLIIGHGTFFERIYSDGATDDEMNAEGSAETDIGDDVAGANTVSTNPCCAFMNDEAVEAVQKDVGITRITGGDEGNCAEPLDDEQYGSIEEPLLGRTQSEQ
eukprot:CAMPEP_0113553588 /NCGR_PEP_ID=MMETSP0015_2-20120614/15696_1 /TAXON_ID=2838 /ORGANISM="Odontella" /LENGTH=239 /DNA_ID=CAMNT_0000454673 /DNA_START=291 /DNA_END=1010 /DNA_ORIENTATION=+ /assembly_acc=CAM_ASM_000160